MNKYCFVLLLVSIGNAEARHVPIQYRIFGPYDVVDYYERRIGSTYDVTWIKTYDNPVASPTMVQRLFDNHSSMHYKIEDHRVLHEGWLAGTHNLITLTANSGYDKYITGGAPRFTNTPEGVWVANTLPYNEAIKYCRNDGIATSITLNGTVRFAHNALRDKKTKSRYTFECVYSKQFSMSLDKTDIKFSLKRNDLLEDIVTVTISGDSWDAHNTGFESRARIGVSQITNRFGSCNSEGCKIGNELGPTLKIIGIDNVVWNPGHYHTFTTSKNENSDYIFTMKVQARTTNAYPGHYSSAVTLVLEVF